MSGTLRIHFAPDMPGAAVEVLAPNLEAVDRLWVSPGDSVELEVPSEASFLRVHLPSGQVATLHDPGNMDREISLAKLVERCEGRLSGKGLPTSDLKLFHLHHSIEQPITLPLLLDGTEVKITSPAGPPQTGIVTPDRREVRFSPSPAVEAYDLSVSTTDGQLRVRLPGMLEELSVHLDEGGDDLRIISVRVTTRNRTADSLGAYMARGDFYSAASMTSWVDTAERVLQAKVADPFAATVGAYLLLKLRRFDLMRSWTRNLAEWWPQLADGSVIWAWQQVLQHGDEGQVYLYLERAAAERPPIFTEGLRLLGDGLRFLGPKAKAAMDKLNQQAGIVLWNSPFTAGIHGERGGAGTGVRFNVEYAS